MNDARRVSDVMRRSVVTIRPDTRIADARWIASEKGVRHLPVVSRDLVGIVCLCDLEGQEGELPISEVMHSPVCTISAGASLFGAARAMRQHEIGCLPVVQEGILLGILTRGDLSRAGLSGEDVFGERTCAACGCHHRLSVRLEAEAVLFCRECLDTSKITPAEDEIGVGD